MSEHPPHQLELSDDEVRDLLRSLRQKEGNWINWGKLCRTLHQAGYDPQDIFEETGFEGIVQNQVIVAAQVYDSIAENEALSEAMRAYCQGPHSDVLYEFRVLNQQQRLDAVALATQKNLDIDGAHQVSRAVKAVERLSQLPDGFSRQPGDAVAYQCWRQARQKRDLSDRARLIAEGLKFAETNEARQQLEALLRDLSAPPSRRAPMLPLYRVEESEQLPRIVPLAGQMPLSAAQVRAVPQIAAEEPFSIVSLPEGLRALPVPGWQAILGAAEPVAMLTRSNELPNSPGGAVEDVVVVVDRTQTEWNPNSYFLIEAGDRTEIHWFDEEPNAAIVGRVVLVLRPKRILDEGNITQPWQMDD